MDAKHDAFVKSHISSPLWGGDKGEGEKNQLKYQDFHPHPSPLPYREREHFGLFTKETKHVFPKKSKKGVVFDNAFTANVVCMPYRSLREDLLRLMLEAMIQVCDPKPKRTYLC